MIIDSKPATVAKNWKGHHVRSEPEGGDEEGDSGELVPARDVRFTKIMLDRKQFEELVGAQAYNSFFNVGKNPHEPGFKSFSTLWLDDVYKDCEAKIVFGVAAAEIELEGATIKNISVKPWLGGLAELAFTLVAIFPRDLATLDFEGFAGKQVTLSASFGAVEHIQEQQNQLPLGAPVEGTAIDKTSIIDPAQQKQEAETERQLGEALRGLDKQPATEPKRGRRSAGVQAGAH